MSKQEKMRTVMKAAWTFVRQNSMTIADALRCAWRNLKLKTAMLAGKAVRFSFRKVDGTVRFALGTLAQAAINYIPNGRGKPAADYLQRFWDLEKGGYRQFVKANLLEVFYYAPAQA